MASASPGPAWSTWPSALPFPSAASSFNPAVDSARSLQFPMSILKTRSQERLDHDAEKAALLTAAQEQTRAEEEISARLPREVLNINKRLDQQQVSLDRLQGDMSNLVAMVSQINTKLGKQPERTASPTEPPPTSTVFSTPPAYHPALSPIPDVSTPGDSSVSATAPPPARPLQFGNPNSLPYVAPKSFGEIPTPRSGYENYYYRHPNPIHNSCVLSGSTNLSEQHLGLPHHYGFDNLNCQTVFRADGSEHSYFALPENYSLELATPEQVLNINADKTDACSNEFVEVFTSNLKLQQHDDEKTSNCLVIKASDSVLPRPSHFSSEHSMRESSQYYCTLRYRSRKEQRPEHINCTTGLETAKLEQEDILISGAVTNVAKYKAREIVAPSSHCMKHAKLRLLWDPGVSKFPVLFMTATAAAKLQGTDVYKSQFTSSYEIQKLLNSLVNVKEMIPWPFWKFQKLQHGNNQQGNVLMSEVRRKEWNPGILNQMDNMLEEMKAANPLQRLHIHIMQLVDSYSEPVQQLVCYSRMFSSIETILSAMSMTTATTVHMTLVLSFGKIAQEEKNAAAVYHVLLIQLPMTKTSQISDPGIESLFFSCKPVKFFTKTAAIMCCSLPKLIQQRRNVAAVIYSWRSIFHDMHYRQIFQKCKAMSSQLYWHEDIKFIGISLWLISFNPP